MNVIKLDFLIGLNAHANILKQPAEMLNSRMAAYWSDFMLSKIKTWNKNVILILIVISYIVRLAIAPFHIMVPDIPHDFYAYIGPAKCLVEGNFPKGGCLSWKQGGSPSVYGPILTFILLPVYLVSGQYDFFMYKVAVILFDIANIILIYFISKKILGTSKAAYVALIYSLSFMTLFNSAVIGNDEIILIFLFLSSVYFLISKKMFLSSFIYVLTILIKPFPIVIAPALLLYAYKKYGKKITFQYVVSGCISLSLMFLIFLFLGGFHDITYYFGFGTAGAELGYTSNMSFFNILKYITNINFGIWSLPIFAISLVLTFIFTLKIQVKNLDVELMRNLTLFITIALITSNVLSGVYTIIFYPFLLIFIFHQVKVDAKKFDIKNITSVLFVIIGLIIYSSIYREGLVSYSNADRVLLLLALFMVTIGDFYFIKILGKNMRLIWSFVVFSTLMFMEVYAAPILVFPLKYFTNFIDVNHFTVVNRLYGEHIGGNPELLLGYGIFYAVPCIMLFVSLILMYVEILKMGKNEN
jgi:Gpi18-like mannosyltransferase